MTSGKMSGCGRKALTLLSSVFAVCGLGLLGIAVSTDYWLYLEEGVVLPQNQSVEIKMSLHSGLWRVCFLAGKGTAGWDGPAPERGAAPAPAPGKPAREPPHPPPSHRWEEMPTGKEKFPGDGPREFWVGLPAMTRAHSKLKP